MKLPLQSPRQMRQGRNLRPRGYRLPDPGQPGSPNNPGRHPCPRAMARRFKGRLKSRFLTPRALTFTSESAGTPSWRAGGWESCASAGVDPNHTPRRQGSIAAFGGRAYLVGEESHKEAYMCRGCGRVHPFIPKVYQDSAKRHAVRGLLDPRPLLDSFEAQGTRDRSWGGSSAVRGSRGRQRPAPADSCGTGRADRASRRS